MSVTLKIQLTCLNSHLFCFADIDTPFAEDVTTLPTPEKDWSHHMVRGSWFTKTGGLYNYGLPSPLLAYLRTTLQDDALPANDSVTPCIIFPYALYLR